MVVELLGALRPVSYTHLDVYKRQGIPNYGYDWPLPFVRGTTAARGIGNHEAVQIAALHNVSIQYDEESQAPFFEYTSGGISHIVWFEDVRSCLLYTSLPGTAGIMLPARALCSPDSGRRALSPSGIHDPAVAAYRCPAGFFRRFVLSV